MAEVKILTEIFISNYGAINSKVNKQHNNKKYLDVTTEAKIVADV